MSNLELQRRKNSRHPNNCVGDKKFFKSNGNINAPPVFICKCGHIVPQCFPCSNISCENTVNITYNFGHKIDVGFNANLIEMNSSMLYLFSFNTNSALNSFQILSNIIIGMAKFLILQLN